MEERYHPTVFTYQRLKLQTLLIDRQAWFCLRDLGRLMGKFLDERATRKLSPCEYRSLPLDYCGHAQDTLMVSEAAAYVILIHHSHPTNHQLRQWLSHTVLPLLREAHTPTPNNLPSPGLLEWQGGALNVVHWQNEPWIKLSDMPSLLPRRGG